jgi:hypothetical protein
MNLELSGSMMNSDGRAPRLHAWASLVALTVVVGGCGNGDEGPALVASPDHGSLFGNYDVTISGDLSSLGDISLMASRACRCDPRLSLASRSAPRASC